MKWIRGVSNDDECRTTQKLLGSAINGEAHSLIEHDCGKRKQQTDLNLEYRKSRLTHHQSSSIRENDGIFVV